jgi:hypothetical protein
MSPGPARSAIQSSATSMPPGTTTRSIHGTRGTAIGLLLTTNTLSPYRSATRYTSSFTGQASAST